MVAREKGIDCDTIEIWFADEARIGQKNKITHRWAKRGTRPSAPRDQRTASTYIFGAVCPKQGKGAALILPTCNSEAMNLHLAEIAKAVAPAAHAILLVDQAGWHLSTRLVVPANITIMALPPKCPELNPVENLWQTVCSLSARMWLVHAMQRARVASDRPAPCLLTGDEPCRKIAKSLWVLIPPR
jgi:putative transposase